MAEQPSDQASTAGDEADSTPLLTNSDRLRAHLKPDGLANALLDAWLADGPADIESRMLKALEDFHKNQEHK
jgi:hypothetical protein